MNGVLKGLQILQPYGGGGNGDFAAAHDIIWAGPSGSKECYNDIDIKKLEKLGWFFDEEFNSWAYFC